MRQENTSLTKIAERVINKDAVGIQKIRNSFKAKFKSSDDESIFAINIFYRRVTNQARVQVISADLSGLVSNAQLLSNNLLVVGGDLDSIASGFQQTVYIYLTEADKDNEVVAIENIVLTLGDSGQALLASAEQNEETVDITDRNILFKICIDSSDIELHNQMEDVIIANFPRMEICTEVFSHKNFDPSTHEIVDVSTWGLEDGGIPYSYKKKPFIQSTTTSERYKSFEVLGALRDAGIDADAETNVHEALAVEAFKLWYYYDPNGVKTAVEFITEVFEAPSCIRIQGVLSFLGAIRSRKVKVSGTNLTTGVPEEITLTSSAKVAPVTRFLQEYLDQNISNVWTTLIEYDGKDIRVESITPVLEVWGMERNFNVEGFTAIIEITERFHTVLNTCMLLNDKVSGPRYRLLMEKLKGKLKPFSLPKRYLVYLRRAKGYLPPYPSESELEELSMWAPQNRAFSHNLHLLSSLVPPSYLIETNKFHEKRGFISSDILIQFHRIKTGGHYARTTKKNS
jgi:hypothetical protein